MATVTKEEQEEAAKRLAETRERLRSADTDNYDDWIDW